MVSLSVTVAPEVVHEARCQRYQIRTQGDAGERWPVLRQVRREARHSRTGATDTRPCTHKAAGQLMSAQHPTASEKRTSPKFAFGPGGDVAEHVSSALRSRECGDCARPAQPR